MAYDFYFAGSQCPEADELIVKLNANRLLSYVNDRNQISRYFNHKKNGWKGKLIIDSGAFTAHTRGIDIDIDNYIKWLNENKDYIDFAIVLDHIPGKFGMQRTIEDVKYGAKKSFENYEYMIKKLDRPEMLLPVFHQEEDFSYFDKYLNYKLNNKLLEYMCISARKDFTGKQRKVWYDVAYRHIKKSNNPNIKTHILGSATDSDVEQFPVTSMDATSWIMTSANGSIFTPYGIIYVGNDVGNPNHIFNQGQEAIDKLEEYLGTINLTIQDVMTEYKNRTLANVYYTFNNSKILSYKKQTIKRRNLL